MLYPQILVKANNLTVGKSVVTLCMDIFKVIRNTKFLALYLNIAVLLLFGSFTWANGLKIKLELPVWILIVSGIVQATCLYFRYYKKHLTKQYYKDMIVVSKENWNEIVQTSQSNRGSESG